MVEPTLSDLQAHQANQLSDAFRVEIEKEQASKLQDLQHMYAIAHSGLVSFLTLLEPEFIEKWTKSGKSLSQLDDRFAQMRVTELLKGLREKAAQPLMTSDEEVHKRMVDLEKQLAELQDELELARQKGKVLEQENQNLRAQTTVQQQVQQLVKENAPVLSTTPSVAATSPVDQGIAEPDWMIEWRKKKTFERDIVLLALVGETGISRRPKIVRLAAERLGLKPDNSAIVDALNRIESRGLVERLDLFEKRGADTGGVLPYLYRLTDQGRQAFWLLSGKNAFECEFDVLLRRHKTPEHTLLNMKVREFLEEHQVYQVLLESPFLTLPDGHNFEPDITVKDLVTSEVIYIEVERETNKDTLNRTQKWQSLYAASNGNIRVICDKPGFMRKLVSEINFALSGLQFATWISNMEEIEQALATKGSIWIMERQ
jgi:DNA-binding PadR family transcriptional regulator